MSQFDKVWDRSNSQSMKWDGVDRLYGGEDLWPMWVADMDFKAPEEVITALRKRVDHGIFGYPNKTESLDIAVIEWLEKRYRWNVTKGDITYTSGVVPAIHQLILAFTNKQDKIIIQPPVYYPFFKVVTNNDRTLVENPLQFDGTQYHMDFEHLESVIDSKTKMLILCSPHNPVGRVWTEEELQRLATICIKHDLLLISDEIHADLIFKNHTHTSIATLSDEIAKRTFTCLAPSKTFNLAGIQASFVVTTNNDLKRKFDHQLSQQFLNMTNNFSSVATEASYRHGESWLEELILYVMDNVKVASDYISQYMPKIKIVQPQGTYLIWLDCSELEMTSTERKKWWRDEAKVALSHGIVFGKEGEAFERINLACPKEILLEGLSRMRKAYEKRFN
ncbi:MalY/PatB family protein [Bacillus alkalicellulosilyticus]|uniref:MalY/PatB family protein n=1 Tax=Alkalihalobacterium alkalicellulosilyticum TaxID=1912214 RepID=UPI00099648DD|nr:MalY/PatB family protein [Bacillus alkalicellulosilyticus]